MSLLEVKNLSHIYGQGTPFESYALKNVSFSVNEGEVIGIIGHTGSGKSTLATHLNALLKPTSGEVLLNGKDINSDPKNIRNIRFQIGLVFQYPEHQLFEETVKKDIAFGPKNMGLSDDEIEKRVLESARFSGLDESLLIKSPFEISGGEKRRAAIAGVIAMDPQIVIFDEPTAGLDPKGRDNLLSGIQKYHKENNKTIIYISHSMEDVALLCDKVLVMNKGEIAMFDYKKKVFARGDELKAMGLKIPSVTSIMQKLKASGLDVSGDALTVEEAVNELLRLKKRGGNNA